MAMYINNKDLELLIRLENKIGQESVKHPRKWGDDLNALMNLIESLIEQRQAGRDKTREILRERRKIDKNYGRGKKN